MERGTGVPSPPRFDVAISVIRIWVTHFACHLQSIISLSLHVYVLLQHLMINYASTFKLGLPNLHYTWHYLHI